MAQLLYNQVVSISAPITYRGPLNPKPSSPFRVPLPELEANHIQPKWVHAGMQNDPRDPNSPKKVFLGSTVF